MTSKEFYKEILVNELPLVEIKKFALDLYVKECQPAQVIHPAGYEGIYHDTNEYGFNADVCINLYPEELADTVNIRVVSMPRHQYSEVTYLLNKSQKINAIKIIRSIYTVGLKAAKNTIDNWNYSL
jgi:hypothetical protein